MPDEDEESWCTDEPIEEEIIYVQEDC